jgi:hypothetical protein
MQGGPRRRETAETLREGEEIAEKIAAAHKLPVVRLTPGESAQDGVFGVRLCGLPLT